MSTNVAPSDPLNTPPAGEERSENEAGREEEEEEEEPRAPNSSAGDNEETCSSDGSSSTSSESDGESESESNSGENESGSEDDSGDAEYNLVMAEFEGAVMELFGNGPEIHDPDDRNRVFDEMYPVFPISSRWFADLPVSRQRLCLKDYLKFLKPQVEYTSNMFKFISYYWPSNFRNPIQPLPANGWAHTILLQTFSNGPADQLTVNMSLRLDDFYQKFLLDNVNQAQGAADRQETKRRVLFVQSTDVIYKLLAYFTAHRFQCPRMETCSYGNRCPFVHNRTVPELPDYVCFNYLTHQCTEELRDWRALALKEANDSQEPNTCENDECRFGLHVNVNELLQGFDVDPANKARIEAYRKQFPNEAYECMICNHNIRLNRRVPTQMEYCIFPNCNHILCARCIIQTAQYDNPVRNQKQYRCPFMCPGDKALFQHYEPVIADAAAKRDIFAQLPSSLVHTFAGFVNFAKYNWCVLPFGQDNGVAIESWRSNNPAIAIPSRVVDILIRAKVAFSQNDSTMAYFPPMLPNHFGLSRNYVIRYLNLLEANGQRLYEFDHQTERFVPFRR